MRQAPGDVRNLLVADARACRANLTTDRQIENVQHYLDLGFDEIYLHNVGRDQASFIEVFGKEVLPHLRLTPAPVAAAGQAAPA